MVIGQCPRVLKKNKVDKKDYYPGCPRVGERESPMQKPALTERVMVSPEIKQTLFGLKRPGKRLGDVIERIIRDRKRDEFIEYLDKRARDAEYVPIESDPEMAHMMRDPGSP